MSARIRGVARLARRTALIGVCGVAAAGLTSYATLPTASLAAASLPVASLPAATPAPAAVPARAVAPGLAPVAGVGALGASPLDRRVFVEGDSLTVGTAEFLPDLLAAAGWTATLDAEVGRDTPTGISILADRMSEVGATLVIALGTNDVPDAAGFSARIDQVMLLASGRRVIWVTADRSGWDGLDGALIAAQTRWANLRVIDWRPVVALEPAMKAADGIHLTPAGYRLRAEFIAAAVESAD